MNDKAQTVGMAQKMAEELVRVFSGDNGDNISDDGTDAYIDDENESWSGYFNPSDESEGYASQSLGKSHGEDATCTSQSLGSLASSPGRSEVTTPGRKSSVLSLRRGRASSCSPSRSPSKSHSPRRRSASKSPRRTSSSRSPSRTPPRLEIISPPNCASPNSVKGGSARNTITRTFSGEIAEEKKDDDCSRASGTPVDPIKGSDDSVKNQDNAQLQQNEDSVASQ